MAAGKFELIPTRILTTVGWLRASVQLRGTETLLEHVEAIGVGGQFLAVVDAEMPASADRVPFLALQRSAVTLIVPDVPEVLQSDPPTMGELRPARFLLEHGFLNG